MTFGYLRTYDPAVINRSNSFKRAYKQNPSQIVTGFRFTDATFKFPVF
jgi:hypothetical protein